MCVPSSTSSMSSDDEEGVLCVPSSTSSMSSDDEEGVCVCPPPLVV